MDASARTAEEDLTERVAKNMEPYIKGFCRGCNMYSEYLHIRPARNLNSGEIELGTFCPKCVERFDLSGYCTGDDDE